MLSAIRNREGVFVEQVHNYAQKPAASDYS